MRKKKLNKKIILQAIKGSYGLISTIAQRLKVDRKTIRNYLNEYPDLQEALIEETENVIDFTESKLMQRINENDISAIKYYLSSRGTNRGYGKDLERIIESLSPTSPTFIKIKQVVSNNINNYSTTDRIKELCRIDKQHRQELILKIKSESKEKGISEYELDNENKSLCLKWHYEYRALEESNKTILSLLYSFVNHWNKRI